MRRLSKALSVCVLAAVAGLVLAGSAIAASPLDEYQQTGQISPCKYSSGQLGGAIPNDVDQYAPDYRSALDHARRQQAGGCGGGGSSSGSGGGVGSGPGGGGSGGGGPVGSDGSRLPAGSSLGKAPTPPRVVQATGGRESVPPRFASARLSTPAPILALAIIAAVAMLIAALGLSGRLLGLGLGWLAPLGHATRETALWTASGATGIADWARAGIAKRAT